MTDSDWLSPAVTAMAWMKAQHKLCSANVSPNANENADETMLLISASLYVLLKQMFTGKYLGA